MNTEAMPAQGPVDVTVGHEEVPTFTFRGNELIGFLWHVYALARIGDAIKNMPGMQKEADPMEDQEAQNELIRGWIDELQALPCRDDGTVEFTDEPWIVNVTPNALGQEPCAAVCARSPAPLG